MHGAGWVAFAVAFTIGATDGVDGWLARRQGTTRSGAFLDPLADKAGGRACSSSWPPRVSSRGCPSPSSRAREVGMSVYRAVAGRRGISIPARTSAKVKTLVQGIAILLALAPPVAPHQRRPRPWPSGWRWPSRWSPARSTCSTAARRRTCAHERAAGTALMRIEVVAVGTELLLGQIADTNSAWLGEQLALGGVDSHFHQAVGDNQERIVLALRTALARSDGVVVCGGLGPTHDDITRDAIAEVMGVALVRDPGHRRADRRDVLVAGPGHAREQRPPGRRARRGHPDPPACWGPPPGSSARWATRSSTPCPACPTRCTRCSPAPCSPTCGAGWPSRATRR